MQNPILGVLKDNKEKLFPILGTKFAKDDYCEMDLSIYNTEFEVINVESFEGLEAHVNETLVNNYAKIGIGGYAENRPIYRSSDLYANDNASKRCIHLALDLWTEVQTKVFSPLDATVHSFKYNDQPLDYGATIILEHRFAGTIFYTLYGHLSLKSLDGLEKGKVIEKGTCFAKLGAPKENGGWPPHLHFQLILDMLGYEGDFPGVSTENEAPYYMNICPNPAVFFDISGVV
jgi:murein DD-endopeptidase MepM/ murein hydrolase activator NlpD